MNIDVFLLGEKTIFSYCYVIEIVICNWYQSNFLKWMFEERDHRPVFIWNICLFLKMHWFIYKCRDMIYGRMLELCSNVEWLHVANVWE